MESAFISAYKPICTLCWLHCSSFIHSFTWFRILVNSCDFWLGFVFFFFPFLSLAVFRHTTWAHFCFVAVGILHAEKEEKTNQNKLRIFTLLNPNPNHPHPPPRQPQKNFTRGSPHTSYFNKKLSLNTQCNWITAKWFLQHNRLGRPA